MSFVSLTSLTPFVYLQSLKDRSVNTAEVLGSKIVNTYNSARSLPAAIADSTQRILSVAGTAWRTKNIAFQITKASIPATYKATKLNVKSPKNIAAQSVVNISKDILAHSDNIDFITKMISAKLDLKQFFDSEDFMSWYSKPVFSDYFIYNVKKIFCHNQEYGALKEAALVFTKEVLSPLLLLVAFFKAFVPFVISKVYINNLDRYITKHFENFSKEIINEKFLKKFFVKLVEKINLLKDFDPKLDEIPIHENLESVDVLTESMELDKKFKSDIQKQTKQILNKLCSFMSTIDNEKPGIFDNLLYNKFAKRKAKILSAEILEANNRILKNESQMTESLFHNLLNSLLNTDISEFHLHYANREAISIPSNLEKSKMKQFSMFFRSLPKNSQIELIQSKKKALDFIGALQSLNMKVIIAILEAAEEAFKIDNVSEETFINAVGEIPNALNPAFVNTANEALKEMTDTAFSLTDSFPSPVKQVLNFTTVDGAREMIRANKASSVFANQKNTIAKYLNSLFKKLSQHCNDENIRKDDKKELNRVKRQYNETLSNVSIILSPVKRAIAALKPF